MEKIIVAFESEKSCERICDILEGGSVAVCCKARSGGEVKRLVAKQHIGTIVCGYKLRDGSAEDLFYDLPPASTMVVIARQDMLDMLSDDMVWSCSGTCGKKQPMPVGMGGPAVKCKVNVAGK